MEVLAIYHLNLDKIYRSLRAKSYHLYALSSRDTHSKSRELVGLVAVDSLVPVCIESSRPELVLEVLGHFMHGVGT